MEITAERRKVILSQEVDIYNNAYLANDGNNWILTNLGGDFVWKRMCALQIETCYPTFKTPEDAIVYMIEKSKGKVVTCDYEKISTFFNSLL